MADFAAWSLSLVSVLEGVNLTNWANAIFLQPRGHLGWGLEAWGEASWRKAQVSRDTSPGVSCAMGIQQEKQKHG